MGTPGLVHRALAGSHGPGRGRPAPPYGTHPNSTAIRRPARPVGGYRPGSRRRTAAVGGARRPHVPGAAPRAGRCPGPGRGRAGRAPPGHGRPGHDLPGHGRPGRAAGHRQRAGGSQPPGRVAAQARGHAGVWHGPAPAARPARHHPAAADVAAGWCWRSDNWVRWADGTGARFQGRVAPAGTTPGPGRRATPRCGAAFPPGCPAGRRHHPGSPCGERISSARRSWAGPVFWPLRPVLGDHFDRASTGRYPSWTSTCVRMPAQRGWLADASDSPHPVSPPSRLPRVRRPRIGSHHTKAYHRAHI